MAKIKINNKHNIEGKVSLVNTKDDSSSPIIVSYSGVLSARVYIEDLNRIETDKFIIDGVNVYYESLGSEEDDILYEFTAKSMKIKEELKLR